ncbi:hypothetical protein, partial [Escherichia coli]|uniref:hypothetical protein n=1 Tax=Escherichia coli TaxID=562 RepID=UPI003D34DD7F
KKKRFLWGFFLEGGGGGKVVFFFFLGDVKKRGVPETKTPPPHRFVGVVLTIFIKNIILY